MIDSRVNTVGLSYGVTPAYKNEKSAKSKKSRPFKITKQAHEDLKMTNLRF